KIAFSMLKRELKQVEEKEEKENWIDKRAKKRGEPWQKMEEALKNTLQQEINPKNQEKIQLEKEILRLREERKKINQEKEEGRNSNPQFLREKIREIYQHSQNQIDMDCKQRKHSVGENNILLKNIDKITNPALEKELLIILDPTKNTNLGKYQKKLGRGEIEASIDLSKFLLIATTSTVDTKLSEKLRAKLNHVEPFLDRYF
ncbi:10932_t:CDS:2, partial [Funneliformis geosporum]